VFKVKARLLFQLLLFESENVLQKSLLLAAAAAAAATFCCLFILFFSVLHLSSIVLNSLAQSGRTKYF
jgi:hypothetical protein